MEQFLEDQHLLEDFVAGVVVLHVDLVDALDGYQLVGKYLAPKVYLSEASLPKQANELVVIKRGLGITVARIYRLDN